MTGPELKWQKSNLLRLMLIQTKQIPGGVREPRDFFGGFVIRFYILTPMLPDLRNRCFNAVYHNGNDNPRFTHRRTACYPQAADLPDGVIECNISGVVAPDVPAETVSVKFRRLTNVKGGYFNVTD